MAAEPARRGVIGRNPVPRRQAWLIGAIGAVLVAAFALAASVQVHQFRTLNSTVQYQGDYLLVNLNQLELEYLRLQGQWRRSSRPEGFDRAALQLRYDLFVSMAALLETERAARLIADRHEFDETAQRVQGFIAQADRYLGPEPAAPLDAGNVAALAPLLESLAMPIHRLSLSAGHEVAAQMARRNAAVREHNIASVSLTLVLCISTLGFALIAVRQMRQLERRQKGLEALAARLRDARHEAEAASEAKSVFLANMSHEIRTPFQGLLGMLALLRDTPLGKQQLDYLGTATQSADHLLAILNDILDVSKLEAGTLSLAPEPVPLRRLLDDVEALMRGQAASKGLALRFAVDAALPERVIADATRVKQVLFNLTSNAIKFSDHGEVVVSAGTSHGMLAFTVVDTGIGMDDETMARLFQRFTQGDASRSRRHGGTGLGLEISRNLARLMGGDIRVSSSEGEGSTFTFVMPLRAAPAAAPLAAPAAVAAQPAPEPVQALEVLVAEDNAVNRKYLEALLERLGHRVAFAVNGREAVALAAARRFDIVLMDLHMPELDGVGATTAIRALGGAAGQVPIVALTADAFAETRERCLAAGMVDFLTKPIDVDALRRAMQRHARRADPAAAHPHPAAPVATPAVAAAPPLLDRRVQRTVVEVMGGERFQALARQFLAECAGHARQPAPGGHEALRAAMHAIKGAALNLGFARLAAAADLVRAAAAHGDVPALADAQAAFDSTHAATVAALGAGDTAAAAAQPAG